MFLDLNFFKRSEKYELPAKKMKVSNSSFKIKEEEITPNNFFIYKFKNSNLKTFSLILFINSK